MELRIGSLFSGTGAPIRDLLHVPALERVA